MFMAPEIKSLVAESDETAIIDGAKADIYSLGISMLSIISPDLEN